MGLNLCDIKVLIVEDDENHYNSLKQGLKQLGINQIFPTNFREIKEEDLISDLYVFYKDLIIEKQLDIVFFDLALKAGEDATDGSGAELIAMFLNSDDDRVRFIPKIILTGATNTDKLDALVKQEVKIVIEKKGNDYYKLLVKNSMNKTMQEFTKLYRELIEHVQYKKELEDIKNKVLNIETVVKVVASSLPRITDKKSANKLIANWEENDSFKNAMQDQFPSTIDNLFSSVKDKIEKLKDGATENITEALLEQVKEYIDQEAEISGEETKMIKFFKYSAYVLEEIERVVHK